MDVPRAPHVRAGRVAVGARRHRWLLCCAVLVGLSAGTVALYATPASYRGTTSVLVSPVPADAGAGAASAVAAPVNLATEAQLARSTETAARAAALLRSTTSVAELTDAVAVEPLVDTSILVIRFTAASPGAAQAGARAFAQAYLANRASAAAAALRWQTAIVTGALTDDNAQLAQLDARIAALSPDSAAATTLRSTRATLAAKIASLSARADNLATTAVTPGKVIRDAELPRDPVRGALWLFLVLGGGAGLVVGAAAALVRERLSVNVRDGADVTHRSGLTVLASLPREGRPEVIRRPDHHAYDRLRNEVVAALSPADRVLLVTAASRGASSTVVAANLASALARVGHEVILIGANVPELGADTVLLSTVFDIADIPGLTDVLCGRIALAAAMQTPPREPRLRVVTPGGTASANGLLQSQAVRGAIARLRGQAQFILVDTPSAAAGADAQSLAGLADAAILVAETERTAHAQVADAAQQLRAVGARMLGAVLIASSPTVPSGPAVASYVDDDAPPPDAGGEEHDHARRVAETPAWLTVDASVDEPARRHWAGERTGA
jgi:Mrp family chromosome partitioning ATPase